MTDIIDMMESEVPTDSALNEVAELARHQLELEDSISGLEKMIKNTKEKHRKVQEELLPAKMTSLGISQLSLESGAVINIKNITTASITKKNQPTAFKWLRENGFGDLIRDEVKVKFGMGQEEDGEKLISWIEKNCPIDYSQKKSVHSQTLRSFVKEQMDKGVEIPEDLFGVFIITKAIIKKES